MDRSRRSFVLRRHYVRQELQRNHVQFPCMEKQTAKLQGLRTKRQRPFSVAARVFSEFGPTEHQRDQLDSRWHENHTLQKRDSRTGCQGFSEYFASSRQSYSTCDTGRFLSKNGKVDGNAYPRESNVDTLPW